MLHIFHNFQEMRPLVAKLLIRGQVFKEGLGVSCVVQVYSQQSGQLVSRATTDNAGRFHALGVRNSSNYVISNDPDKKFNIAAQDDVL